MGAENFWNLKTKRLPLRPFLGQCNAPQRPDCSQISQATLFTDETCETIIVHLEEWKGVGKVLSHCSQPSHKFQHVTCVLAGLVWVSGQAMTLIGDLEQARDWRHETKQATSDGKRGQTYDHFVALIC